RKGSSLGKETRSPNTSTFLYSSLLYSTFLYPIASCEQFAICIFQFSICNPSYLPSPKPLLFSTLLYFSLPYSLLRANLQFSLYPLPPGLRPGAVSHSLFRQVFWRGERPQLSKDDRRENAFGERSEF